MSAPKNILAIFDFCETLVDFQSAARYLELVAESRGYNTRPYRIQNKLQHRIKSIARRLFPKACARYCQSVRYEALRGFEAQKAQNTAREFFINELLPHINTPIIERVRWHGEQGHTLVIVSGGFEIYIKLFAEHFKIPHVVAIKLESNNGLLSGEISGLHTMEHRKLYALDSALDLSQYDLARSYAYSDCPSDIPLLSLVGNPHAVESSQDMQWARILGYTIIPAKPQS